LQAKGARFFRVNALSHREERDPVPQVTTLKPGSPRTPLTC
jgi:hypothetical protein